MEKTFESTPYSSNVWTNNLDKSDIKSMSTPIKVTSVYSTPKWLKLNAGFCSELSNNKPLSNLSQIQTKISLNRLILSKDLEKKCYKACSKSYEDNIEYLKTLKQLDINKLEDIRQQDIIVRKIIKKFNIYLQNYSSKELNLLKLIGIRNDNNDLEYTINQICEKCDVKEFLKVLENNQVDTYKIFLLRLTPNNVNRWFNVRELFDEIFIRDLSNSILSCLENILKNILNLSQYNMWEIYNLSGKEGCVEGFNNNNRIVEHALNLGSKNEVINKTKVTNEQELNSAMNQSSVIGGMTKLVSNAINKAVAKNQSDLMRSLAVSNTIAIGSAKGTSFSISNVDQGNQVQQEINGTFVQSISSKIISDVTTNINDQVDSIKEATKDDQIKNITADDKKEGTNAADLAGKFMDANIGSSTSTTNDNETTNTLKKNFNLDQSFQYKKEFDATQALNNALKSENLAKCVAKSQYANTIAVAKIDVTGPISIDSVKQQNIVRDLMSCAFSQSVISEIANKMVSNMTSMIKQCVKGVDRTASNSTFDKKATAGDIYAVGGAVAGILSSAGSAIGAAAEGIGSGIGTAGKGLGEGIGSAATGLGTGISTAGKGLGEGLGSAYESAGKGVSTAVTGVGSGVSGAAKGLGDGIGTAGKGLGEGIGGAVKGIGEGVSGILGGLTAPLMALAAVGIIGLIGWVAFKKATKE